MAVTYCGVCRRTSVRKARDVCARCRAEGHKEMAAFRPATGVDGQAVDVEVELEALLRLGRTQRQKLETFLAESTASYRGDVTEELDALCTRLTTLSKELRQWQDRRRADAKSATASDRLAVLAEWFAGRPPEEQRRVMRALADIYETQRKVGAVPGLPQNGTTPKIQEIPPPPTSETD